VTVLCVSSVFTSMLVPLLYALLYFSTPHTRRAPVHICVVFTVCVGIAVGTWAVYNSVCRVHMTHAPQLNSAAGARDPVAARRNFAQSV
jgi:hypothetical protein